VTGASAGASPSGGPPAPGAVDVNPCTAKDAPELRCPDLRMKRPFGLYLDHVTRPRRVLLRAGNSIDNVGGGPAEVHGVRSSGRWMRTRQRLYRRSGGRISVRTGARLHYVSGHQGKRYWKLHDAAAFQLWRLDRRGRRTRLVRRGPKVDYCLRDLRRTHPRLRRSPPRRVYPACSTSPLRRQVTVGTSVGWSDIYPPTYRTQWIDVTGLRGCFAYVQIADPRNGIWESNERNNEAQVVIRLPYAGGRGRCRGPNRGGVNTEPGAY
jgi:hypothetical protein